MNRAICLRKALQVAVATALVLGGLAVTAPGADARCHTGIYADNIGSENIGREKASNTSATCDNDGYYLGKLRDGSISDNAAAEAQFKIGSGGWFTQFWTGNENVYQTYVFQYYGSSSVRIRVKSANSGVSASYPHTNF